MKLDQVVAAATKFGRGAGGDAVIAWKDDLVYCLSYDRTVLLRARRIVPRRPDEVVFHATDYEGPNCRLEGPNVIFENNGARVRTPRPVFTYEGLSKLFDRLWEGDGPALMVGRSVLSLLEEGLPHVEFVWNGEVTLLVQRDIYTGKTLELEQSPQMVAEKEPLAMRTDDFWSLFALAEVLLFKDLGTHFKVSDLHSFEAIVGGCIYDDLGTLGVVE